MELLRIVDNSQLYIYILAFDSRNTTPYTRLYWSYRVGAYTRVIEYTPGYIELMQKQNGVISNTLVILSVSSWQLIPTANLTTFRPSKSF